MPKDKNMSLEWYLQAERKMFFFANLLIHTKLIEKSKYDVSQILDGDKICDAEQWQTTMTDDATKDHNTLNWQSPSG